MGKQVQYMVTPLCCNSCAFCLRDNRGEKWTDEDTLVRINNIYTNIDVIDWKGVYSDGISLLGGEIFYTTNKEIIEAFLRLIDHIIDVMIPHSPTARISFVTNGLYDPEIFLFPVLDKIAERVGSHKFDINFSYDIKYRYASEKARLQVIENINKVHDRYDYAVGVQTILTQFLIDAINNGDFDITKFETEIIPGNNLTFLYPHPINPLLDPLPDFQFKRESFIEFIMWLKETYPLKYDSFYLSCQNSAIKKETGAFDIGDPHEATMQPVLSSGKEIMNVRCGHSVLYQAYADSKKCMLCDLYNIGR